MCLYYHKFCKSLQFQSLTYSMPKIKISFLCSCEQDLKMAYRKQVETCRLILYVRNTGIKSCVSVQASECYCMLLHVTAVRKKLPWTGNTEHVRHTTNPVQKNFRHSVATRFGLNQSSSGPFTKKQLAWRSNVSDMYVFRSTGRAKAVLGDLLTHAVQFVQIW